MPYWASACKQLAHSCCKKVSWPGVEPRPLSRVKWSMLTDLYTSWSTIPSVLHTSQPCLDDREGHQTSKTSVTFTAFRLHRTTKSDRFRSTTRRLTAVSAAAASSANSTITTMIQRIHFSQAHLRGAHTQPARRRQHRHSPCPSVCSSACHKWISQTLSQIELCLLLNASGNSKTSRFRITSDLWPEV